MTTQEKSDRLVEAASYLLESAPDQRLNAVTLNKALFYLDLVALRDLGRTLTDNSYIALRHGPVVAKYDQRLIRKLTELEIAVQVEQWDGSKPIVLLNPRNPRYLEAELMRAATLIANHFGHMSSAAASDYSHRNPGWAIAWEEGKEAGRPVPINLRIAMQQIIEVDPWLDSPLSVEEREYLEAADLDDGEEW